MLAHSRQRTDCSTVRLLSPTPRRSAKVPKLALSCFAAARGRTRSPPSTRRRRRSGRALPLPGCRAAAGTRCRSRGSERARSARWSCVSPCLSDAAAAANLRLRRTGCGAGGLDVPRDLRDQLLLALERPLVAQALPQLEREPLAVEVAGEVEQERLDPPFAAAVVRVGADRDRRVVAVGGAGVDAVAGDEQARLRAQVRGRKPERAAARVARDDRARDLGRPAEHRGRALDLAGAEEVADPRRRDALDERHRPRVEAEAAQLLEVARTTLAEAEVRAGDDHFAPDRPQDPLGEGLRRELGELEIEVHDERLLDAGLREQLQPPFERDEQLDAVAERDPRVRVEGDRGRRRPRRTCGVENAPMADVDAVERPERDRPRLRLDLLHAPGDDHSRASASSAVSSRSGSASSTSNGPTAVRRSVAQWPPSAVAIARTYVPELTRRSSRATPSR